MTPQTEWLKMDLASAIGNARRNIMNARSFRLRYPNLPQPSARLMNDAAIYRQAAVRISAKIKAAN
jgi:hypothetical protein